MRTSSRAGRFVLLALSSFAVVTLVAGPSVARITNPWRPTFWEALYENATYQMYESAGTAVKASNAVVVGEIVAVTKSREYEAVPDWGAEGILTFANVEFRVDRVLAGKFSMPPSGMLTWEAMVPDSDAIQQMQASIPNEPHLLLLAHPKGESEGFILLNPESYFVNDRGVARTAFGGGQPWSQQWEGRSFDALVDEIDQAG